MYVKRHAYVAVGALLVIGAIVSGATSMLPPLESAIMLTFSTS